ncbi:hypothetical protein BCR44DRAFT_1435540, partial [Catenaria anguillulae PL171]
LLPSLASRLNIPTATEPNKHARITFQRNFTTKSASAIKSSEWRRTRDRLPQGLLPYLSTVAKVSAERITFATDKATATLYWSVPDNHLLAMDPGNVWTTCLPNHLPSLVACWRAPGGIPTFCTPPQVMEKIFQAADLMAPGIFGDLPDVQPGQVVGVALLGNPRCVLAIGVALMDTHTIATQRKGKAVRIIHFYGDNLWEKCGKPKVPEIAPVVSDEQLSSDNDNQPDPPTTDAGEPAEPGPSTRNESLEEPLVPALDSRAVTDSSPSDADDANPAASIDPDSTTQLAFLRRRRAGTRRRVFPAASPRRARQRSTAREQIGQLPDRSQARATPPLHESRSQSTRPSHPHPFPVSAPTGGRTTRPAWEEEEERALVPPVHFAKRDAITAAVIAAMRKSYRVTDPRTGLDDVRRGEFRKVEISTEKRQGRKVVTVVKYLAQIMPVGGELQGELSTKCASSVSVGDMAGVPAAMGPVVQVQGDQIKFFRTWVAERGVAHLCEFVKK